MIFCKRISWIDQQISPKSDSKAQKHVTFSETNSHTPELKEKTGEVPRNFFMMESAEEDLKTNFLVGGGDAEEIEEKDVFPSQQISRPPSEVAITDKRRRLRWVTIFLVIMRKTSADKPVCKFERGEISG